MPSTLLVRRPTRRLPAGVALYLLMSIVVTFLAGSAAPTPLYTVYQSEWGFTPITTTVVFGVYALAVLASLLVFGSLSDHVGRRPVLLVAIVVQAAAMLLFAGADGVPALLLARIVQGLSTGAAIGAVGAGLLDLDRVKGTVANGVAPLIGTASGGLVSGLVVQYLPAPTHLIYLVLLGLFLVQVAGVALMAETAGTKAGALASLRPRIGVPAAARRPLLVAVPALVAVWALGGFYASVGPALVRIVVGSSSLVLGGLALFVLAGSGGVAVLLSRSARPGLVMSLGTLALIAGVAVTLVAIAADSTVVFFLGTTIAGAGFGGGFQGALRTVVPFAAQHERAGLLSTMYVASYLAMGLPAVLGGFLIVHAGGLLATAQEYGIAVMVLGALALLGLVLRSRRTAAEPRREPVVLRPTAESPVAEPCPVAEAS
jgi:MFS family permease